MASIRRLLTTERLQLAAPDPRLAEPLAKYFVENRGHLSPWSPPMSPSLFEAEEQLHRLKIQAEAFEQDHTWQWYLMPKAQPESIMGSIQISQVHRGAFQSALLGYSLAKELEGKWMMSEAVRAVLNEVFSERGKLHRVQANAMTTNQRSLVLLERLGFVREGLSPRYLYVNGEWRDHYSYALINPDYPQDGIW